MTDVCDRNGYNGLFNEHLTKTKPKKRHHPKTAHETESTRYAIFALPFIRAFDGARENALQSFLRYSPISSSFTMWKKTNKLYAEFI